mgnify:CR=1 FL=1
MDLEECECSSLTPKKQLLRLPYSLFQAQVLVGCPRGQLQKGVATSEHPRQGHHVEVPAPFGLRPWPRQYVLKIK